MRKEMLMLQLRDANKLRIAMISDTHFAVHRKNNVFFKHMVEAVDNFIRLCEERNIDLVIHCGDLFDTKMEIATEGLINANALVAKIARSFPIVIIPGNHDFAYKENAQYNLASNYENSYNIVVCEDYDMLQFPAAGLALHFLPYTESPVEVIHSIKLNSELKNIMFSHLGVAGFSVHAYASRVANEQSAQLNKFDFGKFNKVFLGHYHGYQTDGRITYVSAPLQSRHGDEKWAHGFVFWDTSQENCEFVENEFTPQFKTYELNKQAVEEMLQLDKHYLRLIVKKKVSKELLISLKRKLLKKNYDVKEKFELASDSQLAVIDGWKDFVLKDPDGIIISYIEELEDRGELPFDKARLLEIIGINIK